MRIVIEIDDNGPASARVLSEPGTAATVTPSAATPGSLSGPAINAGPAPGAAAAPAASAGTDTAAAPRDARSAGAAPRTL